jgi:hypothetical protein
MSAVCGGISGRVDIDLARAERHGYHFAAKLVRGAYMVQERKRAAKVPPPRTMGDTTGIIIIIILRS